MQQKDVDLKRGLRYPRYWLCSTVAGGSRAAYNSAKRESNRAVYHAKNEAQKVALQKVDPRSADVYRLAKQMRRYNQDVMGEKPVKNDEGLLSLDEDAKKDAWKEHQCRIPMESRGPVSGKPS